MVSSADLVGKSIPLSIQQRLKISHFVVLGLAIFYPLEEFLEKWIPRGLTYELVRYGSEIILLSLLMWVLIRRVFLLHRWKTTPIDILFLLFLTISLISSLINNLPFPLYFLGIRPLIRFTIVFYIIAQFGYNQVFSTRFAKICLIVGSMVGFIAILQSLIGPSASYFLLPEDVVIGGELFRQGVRQIIPERTRVFSTLGRYDTLGTYLSIMILLITSLYWSKTIPKKYYYVFGIISFIALILSYSRQSWLVTSIGILILMILHKKYKHIYVFGIISISIVFILLLFFSSFAYYSSDEINVPFLNRILEPFSQRYLEISRFSHGRLFVMFEVSRRIIVRSPLLGFGPGNFGSLTARFFNRDFSGLINLAPESARLINDVNWVTLLGQVGLIGTVLFGAILIVMIIRSKQIFRITKDPLLRGYSSALIAILSAFTIMGFFGPNFEVRQVSFFVWAIAGIVFSIRIPSIRLKISN